MEARDFDAVLVLSFGGPDGPEDVMPFLEHVLRGRPVPPGRLEEVAAHYSRFGGRSPINDHNRALVRALAAELDATGRSRPVYWGNRHWHPFLDDTVRDMARDGIRRAAVFVTSAYSSYSGCRQYLEDIDAARQAVGSGAPELVKLPPFFNHPGFVGPLAGGLTAARRSAGPAGEAAPVLMSAHSIPEAQARTCDYEAQLAETARLVAAEAGLAEGSWSVVYQSRSGPPGQPWLGPDILAAIDALPGGTRTVVVCPIGFVSDHMEVVYDLDTQAAAAAGARGIDLVRSPTPGSDPRFVRMVCDLIAEAERPGDHPAGAVGRMGPAPSPCRIGCCPAR